MSKSSGHHKKPAAEAYKKSSFCNNHACVAVAYVQSSYCSHNACVAVGAQANGAISLKDTKDNSTLTIEENKWKEFIKGIKNGDFDQL